MVTMKVAFIGLGLIGGSIAKTIRKKYPDSEIIALNRSEAPLKEAMLDGTINAGTHEVDHNFEGCDYIFLCTPVETNKFFLPRLQPYLQGGCVLTDAGSVKGVIHRAVSELLPEAHFIGGHPMAGSEKSGYANANDHLIENAYYILTPGECSTIDELNHYEKFVASLGAIPLIMSPDRHDYITAAVSHVPHLVAYSLVDLVKLKDTPAEYMKLIAAGGFKDITRIAGSDPTMWEQICLENPENIVELLKDYEDILSGMRRMVEEADGAGLHKIFEEMRDYRASFSVSSAGPIKKIHDIYCDIIDEAGAIATIATILSTSGISIKNIGIVHNRTFEEGALHIEFSDEASKSRAIEVLERHNYSIFLK